MNIDYNAVMGILKNFLENEKTEILGISVGEERQVREAIRNLLTAYEKEKEKNSNSIEKILADDFKRHIDSITIGNSITFPCGWIYKKDLLNLIDNIKWKR